MYLRVVEDKDMYYLTNQDLEIIADNLEIENVKKWWRSINEKNWLEKIGKENYENRKQWKGCVYPDDKKFLKID